jgi:hypothetical protein
VFVVYGEDFTMVSQVAQNANRYTRIATLGDRIQKKLVDTDLRDDGTYSVSVSNLDMGTLHYFAFGVEYQDDEDSYHVVLGKVERFTTKLVR